MHAAERESHVRSYQSLWERACVQIREGRRLQHEKKKPVRRASGEYRGCDCVQRDGQDVFRPGIVRRAVKAGCSRHALLASRFDVRWAVLRVPQLTRDEHVLSVEPASECSCKRVAHFFLVSVCVCSVCIMRGAARVEHASNVIGVEHQGTFHLPCSLHVGKHCNGFAHECPGAYGEWRLHRDACA
jgi:hypothetical protein